MPKFVVERRVLVHRIFEVEAADIADATAASVTAEMASETEVVSEVLSVVLASHHVPVAPRPKKAKVKLTPANSKGTLISPDFKPDIAWAMGRGVPKNVAEHEAEKFVNFWTARGGAMAVKRNWPATWRTWILKVIEQRGFLPVPSAGTGTADPKSFPVEQWKTILRTFERTNSWNPAYGPAPGKPGCLVPSTLSQSTFL